MDFKESLGLKDKFLVVHSGNMGVKQGLEVMLASAQLSGADDSIQYLIVGDGAERERLQTEARAMKLSNVRFLPLLSDDRFKELLAASDVSLVTQQKCVADIVFPSKVITLMASGRAIVASVSQTSEVARVLNVAQAGLVVSAEDPVSLTGAVGVLRYDNSLRHRLSENAREFARRNWDRDKILAGMESQLYALITSGAVRGTERRRIWKLSRSKQRDTKAGIRDDRHEASLPRT